MIELRRSEDGEAAEPSRAPYLDDEAENGEDDFGGERVGEAGIPLLSAASERTPQPALARHRETTPIYRRRSTLLAAICAVAVLVVLSGLAAVKTG
jgi:hypothetical protein